MTTKWKMNCFFCVCLCSFRVFVISVIKKIRNILKNKVILPLANIDIAFLAFFSSKIVLAFFALGFEKQHTFIFWHSFEQVTSPPRPMVFNSPPRSPLHSNPPKWLPAVPSARLLLPICFYVQRQHLKSLNILISIVLSILLCTHPFCCIAFIFCNETMV